MPDPANPVCPPVEGVDFYREGPYTVFTAHYLLRRGYCCESGCRHCPYGLSAPSAANPDSKPKTQS